MNTRSIASRAAAALVLTFASHGALAAAADVTTPAMSFERGRALYERHCVQCHTPDIHRRQDRIPMTRDELRGLVDTFRRVQNLGWTPEEIDDVVEYLNVTRYRFTR